MTTGRQRGARAHCVSRTMDVRSGSAERPVSSSDLKGMTVKFTMRNQRTVPDGTVLMFGIRYEGMNPSKVFTYVALKAAGLWYFTGSGRVPVAAAWLAVERWLERNDRVVEWVKVVTETAQIHPEVEAPETVEAFRLPSPFDDLLGSPGSAGSEQD